MEDGEKRTGGLFRDTIDPRLPQLNQTCPAAGRSICQVRPSPCTVVLTGSATIESSRQTDVEVANFQNIWMQAVGIEEGLAALDAECIVIADEAEAAA